MVALVQSLHRAQPSSTDSSMALTMMKRDVQLSRGHLCAEEAALHGLADVRDGRAAEVLRRFDPEDFNSVQFRQNGPPVSRILDVVGRIEQLLVPQHQQQPGAETSEFTAPFVRVSGTQSAASYLPLTFSCWKGSL
ncbi:hypothetical protein EYF80_038950 [Liparis tanakae]|uniref:Uncharacterized protein n=1 Tax=Liparis tanakae TaxID=230148 RepID=A0A4Z2GB64_9TELE|nr:hypothetical protein EYF80_038950 [Liparis tanakae]